MIRHVAVFRFIPEFTAEQREEWMRMLRALPAAIPELRNLTVGLDQVGGPASHEMAIVADFDDLDGLAAYDRHPAHQAVLRVSAGVKASLATVDFEIADQA
ncbi:Dabb family protein [Microbacterium sp. CPCC 204701]|uniref:Dabb family protein n=1 Tax=Microbacterium sp. CPCC 204701 TaxID=2493084 RepID=UPI000FD7F931|nr:Dabb family protein [Microbacterium sp. CPCC 204701]